MKLNFVNREAFSFMCENMLTVETIHLMIYFKYYLIKLGC